MFKKHSRIPMFSTEKPTHGKTTSGATGKESPPPQFPILSRFYTVSFSKLPVRAIYELLIAVTYCALKKKKEKKTVIVVWLLAGIPFFIDYYIVFKLG